VKAQPVQLFAEGACVEGCPARWQFTAADLTRSHLRPLRDPTHPEA
jgi:hypothetical protein